MFISIKITWNHLICCVDLKIICKNDESCSESNVCNFIMLTHYFRDGLWWYGSRGLTFTLITHIFLPRADSSRKAAWPKGVFYESAFKSEVSVNFCVLKNARINGIRPGSVSCFINLGLRCHCILSSL